MTDTVDNLTVDLVEWGLAFLNEKGQVPLQGSFVLQVGFHVMAPLRSAMASAERCR